MEVTKAIIPVAGYGTRMLPFTKSIEKCMLPLLDKPVIDYNVDACVDAGITDIMFVVSGRAEQLRTYYGHNHELEAHLKDMGKFALLDSIQPRKDVNIQYVEQDLSSGRYGTSMPVWLCRELIDMDEQFLVVNGDQCLYRRNGTSEMKDFIDSVEKAIAKAGIVAVSTPRNESQQYGSLEINNDVTLKRIHEHPEPGARVSRMRSSGNYLLNGSVFGLIEKQLAEPPNERGEYYLTDIVNEYAGQNRVSVYSALGRYFDCGSMDTWIEANEIMRNFNKT